MKGAPADQLVPTAGMAGVHPAVAAPARRLALLPVLFTLALLGFTLLPSVQRVPGLKWSFVGVGSVLLAWGLALMARARTTGRALAVQVTVVKAHWVQALVQISIYIWWGRSWPQVAEQAPLILAQILFLYSLSALLAWTRGNTWLLGFGPFPIILSTNLLLWFRDEVYYLQFLMVATGALGKEFVRWRREGRLTHIFNPSVFGQSLFALGLIFTGTTASLTYGREIAATFEASPHIFYVIFFAGFVVQYLFEVTLMTLAACVTLAALGLGWYAATGSWFFLSINIGATVFLGMHLLITDPATSPRSNLGRVIFGAGYGLGYFILFRVLDDFGVPLFWDKLLPVPILNLLVPAIDRLARSGVLGRINTWWEGVLEHRRMNYVHMGCWAAVFGTMAVTGFLDGPHPGNSVAFWRQAYAEGREHAGHNYLRIVEYKASQLGGNPEAPAALNELGQLYLAGKLVPENHAAAANLFANASALGDPGGDASVARMFLFQAQAASEAAVNTAFAHLEQRADKDGEASYLVGRAYQIGQGRPKNPARALQLTMQGCKLGSAEACKALGR
jgi:hypothetical protein